VAQSSEQAPFTSEIVGSILATNSCMTLLWKESVNALPKVVGFLRELRFPPTGNVDRVGWDYPPNWPFHRSCPPWPDMSHKVAARGLLESLRLDQVELRPSWFSLALSCKYEWLAHLTPLTYIDVQHHKKTHGNIYLFDVVAWQIVKCQLDQQCYYWGNFLMICAQVYFSLMLTSITGCYLNRLLLIQNELGIGCFCPVGRVTNACREESHACSHCIMFCFGICRISSVFWTENLRMKMIFCVILNLRTKFQRLRLIPCAMVRKRLLRLPCLKVIWIRYIACLFEKSFKVHVLNCLY
jgi:hypothetical protein